MISEPEIVFFSFDAGEETQAGNCRGSSWRPVVKTAWSRLHKAKSRAEPPRKPQKAPLQYRRWQRVSIVCDSFAAVSPPPLRPRTTASSAAAVDHRHDSGWRPAAAVAAADDRHDGGRRPAASSGGRRPAAAAQYAKNMPVMQKICKKYAKIKTRYAKYAKKICREYEKICNKKQSKYTQKHAKNVQKYII